MEKRPVNVVTEEEVRQTGKCELHLHIGGSYPLYFMQKIANEEQYRELVKMREAIRDGIEYHSVFAKGGIFDLIAQIVCNEERVQEGVKELCIDLARDNVIYAEFRTGLKDMGNGLERYLEAVIKGIQEGIKNSKLRAVLLLSVRRDTPSSIIQQTIDLAIKYKGKGVVGIDLSGDFSKGNYRELLKDIQKARENGLSLAAHIGESNRETEEQQLWELEHLQPTRVGHGFALHPRSKAWVQNKKLPIEVCLSSFKSQGNPDTSLHPGVELYKNGHPIAICTDDPLLFDCTLSSECIDFAQHTQMTLEQFTTLQNLSRFQYAFDK